MGSPRLVEPDLDFIRELKDAGGDTLKRCYQCATCSTTCNLSNDGSPFPRKELLMASWGQTEDLMKDPDVWLCYQCNDCSINCPRQANPGDILARIREFVFRTLAFPEFMGKIVSSPALLPVFFLIPVVILYAVFSIWGNLSVPEGEIDYNRVFPRRRTFPYN